VSPWFLMTTWTGCMSRVAAGDLTDLEDLEVPTYSSLPEMSLMT